MDAKGSTQRGGAAFLTKQVVGRWLFLCQFLARQISNPSVHEPTQGQENQWNQLLCIGPFVSLTADCGAATNRTERPVL